MSEEFRNDQENLNSQQNSAGTEEHTENQSQNANTAGGTTYSWVNPKLRQDQGQQAGSNPWGAQNSGGWNAAGADAENGSSTATRLPALREQNRDLALREQK